MFKDNATAIHKRIRKAQKLCESNQFEEAQALALISIADILYEFAETAPFETYLKGMAAGVSISSAYVAFKKEQANSGGAQSGVSSPSDSGKD